MAVTASNPATQLANQLPDYEQPLNERMRTFMRLEFLYQQLLYNYEVDATWATRAVISSLLEIMAILTRGDVRSEVHKELDMQIETLKKFQSQPEVDSGRLGTLLGNLITSRQEIDTVGTAFMQPLKDCEFLSSVKHRSSIPGGTCEFDLPEFSHWLRQPYERRQEDVAGWLEVIRPLCDAITEMLWLIRESAQPSERTAINGMYQHRMQKDASCRLLRVTLPAGSQLYPEISGSQHRFTIRFLEWSTIDARAVQTGHDVEFNLSIC
ncbi:MAG: cell division protein ZapD [Gammaproteobacteria bacterium]|nr:cell division protein ZapD [Gammaproteobacteria bacterium]